MLAALFGSAGPLLLPLAPSLFAATLPRITDPSPPVGAAVLSALGELAQLAGAATRPFAPRLLPALVAALQDAGSPARRHAALGALSRLARATGAVSEPYARFPALLPALLRMLTADVRPPVDLPSISPAPSLSPISPRSPGSAPPS